MNRTKLNYFIDVGLAISFFICFFTGLIKWPGLVNLIGVPAYKFLYFNKISVLHDRSGLIMGLLVIVHLALHWKWIVCVTKSFFKKDKA
ncbi:DUF4405 domain-containing protein [Candidatus Woesearchaeota archaeon]|jgi:hypothetical protein|nr:DUF4405 domain-containing protein [Candidatus Woesearchaeota archaeon]